MGKPDRPKVDLMLSCMLEAFRKAGLKPMAVAVVLVDDPDVRTHLKVTRTLNDRDRRRVVEWVTDSLCEEARRLRSKSGLD